MALLASLANPMDSYIVSNNQPVPMHEILLWLQQQLHLPPLTLASTQLTGKQIYATRMCATGFEYEHVICFNDYAALLVEHGNAT